MDNVIEVKVKSTADVAGFDKAKKATKELGETQEHYVEKADVAEQRTLGLKDAIDGTAVVMQGPGKAGTLAYLQGWADIGSGFANFIIPVMGNAIKAIKAMTLENVKAGAQAVKTGALMVANWVRTAAVAFASGVRMAAAWVLSLGPIALVIGAFVVIGGALVTLWKKSGTFRDIVKGAWDTVWKAVKPVVDLISGIIGLEARFIGSIVHMINAGLKPLITAFKSVGGAISGAVGWLERFIQDSLGPGAQFNFSNRSLGTAGVQGGVTSGGSARRGYAHGGITPGGMILGGERGGELLDLPAGMRIRSNADTRGYVGGSGGVAVQVSLSGGDGKIMRAIRDAIQVAVRTQAGGSVQRWAGAS